MLDVADSEAGVRLLRIQDRRHFQRPPQQPLPPYYHQQPLPNIYPPHLHNVNNPFINQPPPPPRHSRYDESVLLNPNRTISDREVPSDEYLDRDTHRLHQDLYYHANQVPFQSVHYPFPQHQPVPYHPYHHYTPPQPQPKLLNPDGKLKKKEKKTKNREKLLLDPFNPSHNIIQTDELKKDQKKKQRLLYKRFDSKENSVSDNLSIQLLKSNFPQHHQKQILPTFVEESTADETSIVDTSDKGVQIDLKVQEKSIQAKQPPPIKIEPKKEEPKECKDHLFDAFRHSGHLHSRIIDLETYFQILEKQEREGNDNSLLDIAVLNNTNLFPEKPPQASSQIPTLQADVPGIHNVSSIPLFNSNEKKANPKDVHIVYELEDYMPNTLSNSLRKSVTISDKPTILTYSNSKIQPVQHSIAHMPIHSAPEQTYTIQKESSREVVQPITKPSEPVVQKKIEEPPKKEDPPKKTVESIVLQAPVKVQEPVAIEDEEPRPPPFEERVIVLGEEKKELTVSETLPKPYVPPVYLDKVIYIDDLRKKESPKRFETTIDMTPVEIPYYEERVIHVGEEIPKEEYIHQIDNDDNISVTTIGSQETYQDYLQRIGIDIDNMPFSSEAVRRKLDMQMAISTRNSLNFSRGSLLLPSDFEDNLMGTLASTLMRDTLKSTKIESGNTNTEDQGPSQTETIEKALRNILKNSKIKTKLEKLKEANVDTSLLNKKSIHIAEIEEYKKLSSLVETEYMKNADYLLAQTEQLKKETKEALEKIDSQLGRNVTERFNETIETIYNQRR